jgi:hypothetical protein
VLVPTVEVGEEPEEELDGEEAHGEPQSSFWRSWHSAKGGYGGGGGRGVGIVE